MSMTSRPSSAGASVRSRGTTELTRQRLLRFGAIIGATVLATMAIGIWSLSSSSSDIASTRSVGDANAALDKTISNALNANRLRLIRTIAMYSDSPTLADQMSTEGQAAIDMFKVNMLPVVQLAAEAGVSAGEIAALTEITDAYVASAKKSFVGDRLVITSETYDAYLAAFLKLRGAQDNLKAVLQERTNAVGSASDSNSTRGEVLVALGSLVALAGLVLIGRRVVASVMATQQLQAEVGGAQERERLQATDLQQNALDLQHKVDSMLATVAAAAGGDLTAQVGVSGSDAVGQMGEALAKLLAMLRSSISTIAANSETLAAASEELQVVSGQMGSNSAETSKQVSLVSAASVNVSRNIETVSAGAEQMAASIKEIARNTSAAAKVAAEAVEAARVTNDTVGRLGESSAEIDEIVKVITGIAQQTNLLALNATIEAARAGEAGKGFAVVANEVKELAKETAKATEDISARIETIQTETRLSVESISGIVSIIDQIAEFQDTIASAVEEQAATTSEIARSVTDASGGSAEITANMRNVSNAADSTAAGASDSQRAASELARMAAELKSLVGQFAY